MKLTLDHIGLVVSRLDDALDLFKKLGFTDMTEATANPLQKVSASFLPITGNGDVVHLEFLEPTGEDSPISKFIRKRGGGLHHLCFEVDDLDAAMAEVDRHGFRVTVAPQDCTAYDRNLKRECSGTSRIAFFLLGDHLLVELIEKGK
jgi:methylmalonyl-CoA/ethylmalonyl-CoA epimerase